MPHKNNVKDNLGCVKFIQKNIYNLILIKRKRKKSKKKEVLPLADKLTYFLGRTEKRRYYIIGTIDFSCDNLRIKESATTCEQHFLFLDI